MSYSIKNLTRAQLNIIMNALELKSRVEAGQLDLALDSIRNEAGRIHNIDNKTMHQVQSMISPLVGLTPGSYRGIGFHEDTDRAWDMYTAIRYYTSWEDAVKDGLVESINSPRDWTQMISVNYDKPQQFGPDPLPVIETND